MEILLAWGLIGAVISALIANSKRRSAFGWAVLGFFFGVIAILIVACLPNLAELRRTEAEAIAARRRADEEAHRRQLAELEAARARAEALDTKKCPMCAEMVKAEARICRFCGHTFDHSDATGSERVSTTPVSRISPDALNPRPIGEWLPRR